MSERKHLVVDLGDGTGWLQRPEPDTASESPLSQIERAVWKLAAERDHGAARIARLEGALEAEVNARKQIEEHAEDWIDRIARLEGILELARDLIGNGFHRSGGTDQTSWDECTECGQADWKGHKAGCRMAELVAALADRPDQRGGGE